MQRPTARKPARTGNIRVIAAAVAMLIRSGGCAKQAPQFPIQLPEHRLDCPPSVCTACRPASRRPAKTLTALLDGQHRLQFAAPVLRILAIPVFVKIRPAQRVVHQ